MMRLVSCVFLMFILISSLALAGGLQVSAEAPGIIVIIDSNITWTKADSPHTLTGPVLVNQGVTLTIEAGAIVDLNGYELRINGTLRAIGTIENRILLDNGTITFTEHSTAWDEQTGTGSILQFAIVAGVEIVNSVPVSINENPTSDNNVWIKEESPIKFTEPVVVGDGEVLTIEAGVRVELNGYDLIVEGTLRVLGSSSDKVYFCSTPVEGPTINFTATSNGWNEQTATGSIIDNAIIERINIVSNVSLKISNSKVTNELSVGSSSKVVDNELYILSITDGSVVVSGNNIRKIIDCYGAPEISNNSIEKITGFGGSPVFSGNNIRELGGLLPSEYKNVDWFTSDSLTVTNNTIERGMYVVTPSAMIVNNTVTSYTYSNSYTEVEMIAGWPVRKTYTEHIRTSGIMLLGRGHIEGNTVTGCQTGIHGGTTIVKNFLINNGFGVKIDYLAVTIQNNTFTGNAVAIEPAANSYSAEIKDNLFVNNYIGIISPHIATVERNLIKNSDVGTRINSNTNVTVLNNTYTGNQVAIEVYQASLTISYNNFESCVNKSISLVDATNSINATNNWWGTTDTQSINLTIRDYKYAFGLGKVKFIPFLYEPNPEATPSLNPKLPEVSEWIALPMLLLATLAVSAYRNRMKKRVAV